MEQETLVFDDQCINKNKFNICDLPISIDKVNFEKIVLSNKEPYDKGPCKYIIGYKINLGIMLLCIKISKINVYAKYSDINNIDMNF